MLRHQFVFKQRSTRSSLAIVEWHTHFLFSFSFNRRRNNSRNDASSNMHVRRLGSISAISNLDERPSAAEEKGERYAKQHLRDALQSPEGKKKKSKIKLALSWPAFAIDASSGKKVFKKEYTYTKTTRRLVAYSEVRIGKVTTRLTNRFGLRPFVSTGDVATCETQVFLKKKNT